MSALNPNNLLHIQSFVTNMKPGDENTARSIIFNDKNRPDISPETKDYLQSALNYIETFELHNELSSDAPSGGLESLKESLKELDDKLTKAIETL